MEYAFYYFYYSYRSLILTAGIITCVTATVFGLYVLCRHFSKRKTEVQQQDDYQLEYRDRKVLR